MITSKVTIKGVSPLLVNRFHEEAQQEASSHIHSRREHPTPEEDARDRLYYTEELGAYFPAENVRQSIITAGSRHKIGRKQATMDLAAAIYITPYALPIKGKWAVDSRAVVIPSTRGRILRHRPIFETWEISFTLSIDQGLIDPQLVRRVLDDAGNYVGIGDFRPARKGPFGRFSVIQWEEE